MSKLFSLKDKTALITGGCGGIGSALIKGFLDAGCSKIAVFDIIKPKVPIIRPDCTIVYYQVNLAYKNYVEDTFYKFRDEFGSIDILVNCAGSTSPYNLKSYPSNLWHKTIAANLNATFYMCELGGRAMIDQGWGGSIINFTSINAAQAMPDNPAYAAAKAGIRHLTKALALDWGKFNIRVNNIGPGYTETQMNKVSLADPTKYRLRAENSMLGRWAKPEEMVGPVVFLASEASSFVTGTDLWVDGGWLSKGM